MVALIETPVKITAATPIYRACSGYVGAWSCWAVSRGVAESYQDNPGFGGATLVESTIGTEYVLDLRGSERDARYELARELRGTLNRINDRNDTIDDILYRWDCAYLYEIWEQHSDVREALPQCYDAVVHNCETYPEYATVVVRLVD
jgi:hypothetical protein